MSGRHYKPIETYRAEDAETLLVTMGSFGQTASTAVDEMRAAGRSVGLAKIRLWRPFPTELFRQAVGKAKRLVVIDRAINMGAPVGPVASEIRSVLYGKQGQPAIYNVVAGLGGRDVAPSDFVKMVERAEAEIKAGNADGYNVYGVRE
jgi:pyruvate ferredoxin oxidoreductase alpha subunit